MPAGSVVDSFKVMWIAVTSEECHKIDMGNDTIIDGSNSYLITKLEEYTNYTINVIVLNAAGSAASDPVTENTREAGK